MAGLVGGLLIGLMRAAGHRAAWLTGESTARRAWRGTTPTLLAAATYPAAHTHPDSVPDSIADSRRRPRCPRSWSFPPHSRESRPAVQRHGRCGPRFDGDARPRRPAWSAKPPPDAYALDLQQFADQNPMPPPAPPPNSPTARPRSSPPCRNSPPLLDHAEVSKFLLRHLPKQDGSPAAKPHPPRRPSAPRHLLRHRHRSSKSRTPTPSASALLIQSDMDVDSDGSDPDRLPDVDASDPTFQPLTSYKWPKRTAVRQSDAQAVYQERLGRLEAEFEDARKANRPPVRQRGTGRPWTRSAQRHLPGGTLQLA